MSEVFIKAQNVSFSYDAEEAARVIPAVDDISLEIKKGEYEKIYVEKYERKAPMTFWSMGGVKYEYIFYIPEESVNQ